MADKEFNALLQVLGGEQQIIQRSDQKAFTLLSILGVFMVFFIVHFTKMQLDTLIFILIVIYFPAAMCALYFLVRVIVPRIRSHQNTSGADDAINPTFFGGISQFNSPDEYAVYLKEIASNEDQLYNMFAGQVFALGKINQKKNENLRRATFFFVTALTSELLIIMTLAYRRAYSYLSEDTFYYVIAMVILGLVLFLGSRYNILSKLFNRRNI